MKVLIVNTYDVGGAANASLRLHEGLIGEEIDVNVLLKEKRNKYKNTFQFHTKKKSLSSLERFKKKIVNLFIKDDNEIWKKRFSFIKNRSKSLEWFSFPETNYDITESTLYKESDIINLHWVAGFLDYKSFFEKNTKPVVWTLHDMNPFTGGEHYLEKFIGIDKLGNPIPRIINNEEEEIFDHNLKIKLTSLKGVDNLTIVAPSKWLFKEAKESKVFSGKSVIHIPNGLCSKEFIIHDQLKARKHLNIPVDKKVILFVAHSIDNKRKGFDYLHRALDKINKDDIVLCAIGEDNEILDSLKNVIKLGKINDNNQMSLAFSAADVFVIPSLMDNLPNTVLESLMCGTPVIGFPVGGIPDLVIDGKNGILAKEISVQALQEAMCLFFETSDGFDANKIRKDAISRYDISIQAKKYIRLFKDMVS